MLDAQGVRSNELLSGSSQTGLSKESGVDKCCVAFSFEML